MLIGTNSSGNYVIFRGGTHITPTGLVKANIVISIVSVALLKRKLEHLENKTFGTEIK